MENQHRMIEGYRELTEAEIERMNRLKRLELEVLQALGDCAQAAQLEHGRLEPDVGRWLALARTNIELGFMAAGRAVARPEGYPQGWPSPHAGGGITT